MEPGWIVGLTVAAVFGYVVVFMLLLEILVALTVTFKRTNVVGRLLLLVPIIVLGLIFIVLDIIHTLLAIWLGYRALLGVRNWWHRGHQ